MKKPYDKIRAEYIYSRKGDRNTAIDKSADIHSVEMLWRKRFGLTKPTLEYVCERLKHKIEWKECGDDSKTIW